MKPKIQKMIYSLTPNKKDVVSDRAKAFAVILGKASLGKSKLRKP